MSQRSVPVGPLWGFFQHIRERSSIPPSLAQYFALLDAIEHHIPQTLSTREDLLAFTKLFWLNDQKFTSEYTYLFNTYIDWDKWFRTRKEGPDTQPRNEQRPSAPSPSENNNEGDSSADMSDMGNANNVDNDRKYQTQPDDIEFELLLSDISDDKSGESQEHNLPDLGFSLSDQSIMPFKARKFVQRLRRKVETAEQVESEDLDLSRMIEDYTENGFIGEVIFEILDASYSNVVMLADRFGSMYAYEFIESHLREAFKQIPHCKFEHYFFYNLPESNPGGAHYLLKSTEKGMPVFDTEKNHWDTRTWFFILSDAGAHSDAVNKDRIRSSLRLWLYLRNITDHVYWLNPVPSEYLEGTTAGRLQMRIPMHYPDDKHLNQLIIQSTPVK